MSDYYDKEGGHVSDGCGVVTFIILFLIFAMIISSIGCSPERKLKKAEEKVLNDPQATDRVGKEWEKTHPCVIDTITSVEWDTLNVPIFVETDCPPGDSTVKVYIKGNERVITKTKTITVEDTRRIYLLMGERDAQKVRAEKAESKAAGYEQAIRGLTDELKKQEKACNRSVWKNRAYFGIPLILIIAGLILKRRIPIIKNL